MRSLTSVKITGKRVINSPERVYDITVKDNHNLFVQDKIENVSVLAHNCAVDVQAPLAIHHLQHQWANKLSHENGTYLDTYHNYVLYVIGACTTHTMSTMEQRGIRISEDEFRVLLGKSSPLTKKIKDIESEFYQLPAVKKANRELLDEMGAPTTGLFGDVEDWVFNIAKEKHIQSLFLDILHIVDYETGKSGKAKVGKAFQAKNKGHREVELYGEYKKHKALMSTYIKGWNNMMMEDPDSSKDFRIRPSYSYLLATGRSNSFGPNLQNVPEHHSSAKFVKYAMQAPLGYIKMDADYSSHEVRVWGIASCDSVMAKTFTIALKCIYDLRLNSTQKTYLIFKYESDTHKINYSNFTGVPVKDVTKEQRQAAKGIVFGCFTGDTIVSTSKGPERLGVLNSKGKKVTVLSKSGSYRKSDGVVSQGVKPVVQVITRQGAITGTNDHHVLTVTADCKLEMKPLRLLKLNDYIVYRAGVFGTHIPKLAGREISTLDAEAMGLFTGDGSSGYYNDNGMGCYRVHHCSIDKREVNKVRQFIKRYTGINPPLTKTKTSDFKNISTNKGTDFYYTQLNNKLMYTLLKDFGLLGVQHVRRVPDSILKAKKEIVAAYLRGYFEADGGFRVTKSKGNAQISVTSVNVDLLTDISYLLRLFGIVGKIYRYELHARLSCITNNMEVSGELIISHNDSILTFLNEIGFITEKKRNIAKVVRKTIKAKRYQKPIYDLPINYNAIRDTYIERAGVNTFRARDVFVEGVHVLPIPYGLHNVLDNILLYKDSFRVLGLADEWDVLAIFADRSCFASAVISEQTDKGQAEVFDVINVNTENKWVANGMVVSNSLYGIGDYSLAASIGRTLDDTRDIKSKFFKKYFKGAKWMKVQCEDTIKHGFVTSLLGRRRNLIGHAIPVPTLQAAFERRAQNSPIQGAASDMGYIAARLYSLALSDIYDRFSVESNLEYMENHDWGDLVTAFDKNPSYTPVGIDSMVHDSIKSQVRYDMYYIAIYLKEWAMTTGVRAYVKKYLGVTFNVDLSVEFDVGATAATMQTWGWVSKDLTVHEDGKEPEVIKCLDTLFKETLQEQVDILNYPLDVKSIMREAKDKYKTAESYLLKVYPLPIHKYQKSGVIN